ncbi:hypothetical protein ERX37_07880 [Macrococcus hajekii]|uniref:Uncharacterized protein n=1 Tax=Macrococcus hajekii TaxID=198482 RepID=A0A4R6BIE8_9STAP|nr:hypothetical protein [Macrococcus hajekii]TDM01412.1 hypothetical protein ERX37_07880 [Macrococcus hajekii]GGA99737.1 hypothetical protein GCM10007190_04740 [Macrococcus hajekii]
MQYRKFKSMMLVYGAKVIEGDNELIIVTEQDGSELARVSTKQMFNIKMDDNLNELKGHVANVIYNFCDSLARTPIDER